MSSGHHECKSASFYTGLASESALACPAAGAASFKEESQNLSCCVDGSRAGHMNQPYKLCVALLSLRVFRQARLTTVGVTAAKVGPGDGSH